MTERNFETENRAYVHDTISRRNEAKRREFWEAIDDLVVQYQQAFLEDVSYETLKKLYQRLREAA